MALTEQEKQTLKKTRLRNLKRKYARLINHSDCVEQCIELKADIDTLERELAMK